MIARGNIWTDNHQISWHDYSFWWHFVISGLTGQVKLPWKHYHYHYQSQYLSSINSIGKMTSLTDLKEHKMQKYLIQTLSVFDINWIRPKITININNLYRMLTWLTCFIYNVMKYKIFRKTSLWLTITLTHSQLWFIYWLLPCRDNDH